MKRWFLPEVPDTMGQLARQAAITVEGMEQFVAWARSGGAGAAQAVRDAEHAADDARRELHRALRSAFSTPLDPEDLYELSERLDAVLNGAKNTVREAEAMGLGPDAALGDMAEHLAEGVRLLVLAFGHLLSDRDGATDEADAAVKAARRAEHVYRAAMTATLASPDVAMVLARRELYRRAMSTGDAIVHVAHRVWYAVVKSG